MNVICYGDSNTYGYDPRSALGDRYEPENRWVDILSEKTGWNVVNQGMNGQEIPTKNVSFPSDTNLLIVMLGTNDLLQFCSPEAASEKMERFLKSLTLDREKIILIAAPSMQFGDWICDQKLIDDSVSLTKHYRALADRLGIRFADAGQWSVALAYDGVHFTEEGHRAFAGGLVEYLNKGE